jgi:hypothetical protein
VSGREVPLLAGVVELGPLADDGTVRGLAVQRVKDHAVADIADRVVTAGRDDVRLPVARVGGTLSPLCALGPAVSNGIRCALTSFR